MGVKSTVKLTRAQANERYVDLKVEGYRRALRAEAAMLPEGELEDVLAEMNDAAKGGEGFENYRIVPDALAE